MERKGKENEKKDSNMLLFNAIIVHMLLLSLFFYCLPKQFFRFESRVW